LKNRGILALTGKLLMVDVIKLRVVEIIDQVSRRQVVDVVDDGVDDGVDVAGGNLTSSSHRIRD
jgi:hypothetical protein